MRGRNINIMATVSANLPGCRLDIRVAESLSSVIGAKVLASFVPSTLQTRITSSVNMRTRDIRQLVLIAEHVCSNSEGSLFNIVNLRTSSILASKSYQRRDFLKRLRFKFSSVFR